MICAGKAAVPMFDGAYETLGAGVRQALVTSGGLEGIARSIPVECIGGSHPLPDRMSVRAGERAMQMAARARDAGELLLVLLSGGASSMLALPADGVSLEHKRQTIASMMRAGAGITQLNVVRKHLSSIKGGRLAAAARRVLTLAISDVNDPEDDPSTIGSGPTTADPWTFADALAMLDGLACEVPAAIREYLQRGAVGHLEETLKPGDARLAESVYQVIANRRMAIDGAAREARRRGYTLQTIEAPTSGEARDAGRNFVERALADAPLAGPLCVVGAGETIVRVRGDGVGGRNQEFVLGAMRALATYPRPALVASIGTDGIDGPTDAAGAIASSATLARMQKLGIDVDEVLARNDAYPALARVDGLIRTGPTATNVGDVHVVLTMIE
jgi:hydroxypyruvate reductase